MSDTPRTDEEQTRVAVNCGSSCAGVFVSVNFARKLERELAEARERLHLDDDGNICCRGCGSPLVCSNDVCKDYAKECEAEMALVKPGRGKWLRGYGSNRQALRRWINGPVRFPIPPLKC